MAAHIITQEQRGKPTTYTVVDDTNKIIIRTQNPQIAQRVLEKHEVSAKNLS